MGNPIQATTSGQLFIELRKRLTEPQSDGGEKITTAEAREVAQKLLADGLTMVEAEAGAKLRDSEVPGSHAFEIRDFFFLDKEVPLSISSKDIFRAIHLSSFRHDKPLQLSAKDLVHYRVSVTYTPLTGRSFTEDQQARIEVASKDVTINPTYPGGALVLSKGRLARLDKASWEAVATYLEQELPKTKKMHPNLIPYMIGAIRKDIPKWSRTPRGDRETEAAADLIEGREPPNAVSEEAHAQQWYKHYRDLYIERHGSLGAEHPLRKWAVKAGKQEEAETLIHNTTKK